MTVSVAVMKKMMWRQQTKAAANACHMSLEQLKAFVGGRLEPDRDQTDAMAKYLRMTPENYRRRAS